MKKLNWKEIAVPTVALSLICLLVTAALAFTDSMTKEPIEKLQKQAEVTARQAVLPSAESFEEITGTSMEKAPYAGRDDSGSVVGYVIVTQAKGYGGTLEVMTGIDGDGKVTGVTILSHSETVGLGANAANPSFTDQYKQAAPENGFVVDKSGKLENGVQALTGATITSKAVTSAVNEAVAAYQELNKKGGE